MSQPIHFQTILKFWLEDIAPSQWWTKDADFDKIIREKFSAIHSAAKNGELFEWRTRAKGRLAEIIILDQFSRNIFRDNPLAFACDGLALILAQEAITSGAASALSPQERTFLYLPFMHSESLKIHEVSLRLYQTSGLTDAYESAIQHKNIIEKFGRYPHRNAILGRTSTKEEITLFSWPQLFVLESTLLLMR
jgi:uncharacterized protein (DUF924 family)